MNQRYIQAAGHPASGARTITVRTPANADIALPGYYMLFVIDRSGTPSVASWVRLR